jgi:alginate O-acetyltransferase complex protein AlgI
LEYLLYEPEPFLPLFYCGATVLFLGARNAHEHMDTFRPTAKNFLGITLLLVWCVMSFSGVSTFLYFNF